MSSAECSRALSQAEGGDQQAASDLLSIVYAELRRLAATYMQRERCDHTLQPTALVHEAYLKMMDQDAGALKGRAHFIAIAAEQMRRVLVDHARGHKRLKRGSGRAKRPLCEQHAVVLSRDLDLIALDDALDELESFNPTGARVVCLRCFGGLTHQEIAGVIGVSVRTVDRKWEIARRWLSTRLDPDGGTNPGTD